ncbi:MAG: hypothetical protein U1E58_01425 [Tabrizicola sp.]
MVDTEGINYRAIGDEFGSVAIAPAATKGTEDDIRLTPDCTATGPPLKSAPLAR